MIRPLWACIFTGPTSSPVRSTLEKDGMTVPVRYFCTAGTYGERSTRLNSLRDRSVMPWSIV